MGYIDVHCHLNDPAFDDVAPVIEEMKRAGIVLAVCSGYDMESSYRARELAEQYDFIYFSAGFQPQEVGKYRAGDIEKLRSLARHEKCLAVGEIGLDAHYPDNPSQELQKEIFLAQIETANEEGLPIVIHSRDCAEDTLSILQENRAKLGHGCLLHCYSYSAEMAERFAKEGACFSFGGTATFQKAKKAEKSVTSLPIERILTETDSPYLTPEPKRGEFPNTPANIPYIAARLAAIKGVSEETFCEQVITNAKRLFTKWK
jgi:TatD DNase family protein